MTTGKTGRLGQRGMTLIEAMVVVAIIGIITLIGTQGMTFYQRYELQSATRQLLGAIEKIRQDAMTKRTPPQMVPTVIRSRGFGIRIVPGGAGAPSGYTTFEFNDTNDDFTYDGTGEEYAPNRPAVDDGPRFSSSITVTPAGVLLYDERGMSRMENWLFGGRTYILTHANVTPSRCVVVTNIRVREGVWNASNCT